MDVENLDFVPLQQGDTACSVTAITPPAQACMHTYYDMCPWSPSGRYLCCLRLPYEDRVPQPGDTADLCVIDLEDRTCRVVYQTTGWGFQTAAHQAWGTTDNCLYCNDMRGDRPIGVRIDLRTGETFEMEGPVWAIAPDGSYAISPCLVRANLTQPSYGVSVPPEKQLTNTVQASADDGLFRVDLRTGRQTLLVPLARVWEALPNREDLAGAKLYAFHAKINPQGTRIMLVVRARFDSGSYLPSLVTFNSDGSDIRTVVPHRLWKRGGHHPIWHPGGREVLMNLTPDETGMHFCCIDGLSGHVRILVDKPEGSGHPSVSPDERYLLTDVTQDAAQRTSTIRLVDLHDRACRDLCRVVGPAAKLAPLRCDAHPVWDRRGRRILFTAAPQGRRQLFILDRDVPPGEVPDLSR